MPDDTATSTRDQPPVRNLMAELAESIQRAVAHRRVAGATVAPIIGAVRIGLPHDLLLESITALAYRCVVYPELLERLVQLGSAVEAQQDHDLRQEVGDEGLLLRLYDAQAPFRELSTDWDVPLSEARTLAVAILTAWGDAGGTPPAVVITTAGGVA